MTDKIYVCMLENPCGLRKNGVLKMIFSSWEWNLWKHVEVEYTLGDHSQVFHAPGTVATSNLLVTIIMC